MACKSSRDPVGWDWASPWMMALLSSKLAVGNCLRAVGRSNAAADTWRIATVQTRARQNPSARPTTLNWPILLRWLPQTRTPPRGGRPAADPYDRPPEIQQAL